jgi:hypothetical protein
MKEDIAVVLALLILVDRLCFNRYKIDYISAIAGLLLTDALTELVSAATLLSQ